MTSTNSSVIKHLKSRGFDVGRLLGKGAFATVYECKHLSTKKFAAKVVETNGQYALSVQTENEIEILKDLNTHRHVVRLHGVLRPGVAIVQFLEYIPGCTFLKGIINWPRFTEQCLKTTIKQLLSGLTYCHSKRIIHRDICPENIMWYQIPTLNQPNNSPVLKLIDFNLARRLPDNSNFIRSDPLGNPSYMAPECMQEKPLVSFCSDVWSVGVIAFTLMAGYPPFWNDNYNHLITNICEANYVMPESLWKHMSQDGKDFIKAHLYRDTDERGTSKELLNHTYLQTVKQDKNKNKVFIGQRRLKTFLQILHDKKNRNKQHNYQLTLCERKAYIPDDALFERQADENANQKDDNSYYHW